MVLVDEIDQDMGGRGFLVKAGSGMTREQSNDTEQHAWWSDLN